MLRSKLHAYALSLTRANRVERVEPRFSEEEMRLTRKGEHMFASYLRSGAAQAPTASSTAKPLAMAFTVAEGAEGIPRRQAAEAEHHRLSPYLGSLLAQTDLSVGGASPRRPKGQPIQSAAVVEFGSSMGTWAVIVMPSSLFCESWSDVDGNDYSDDARHRWASAGDRKRWRS